MKYRRIIAAAVFIAGLTAVFPTIASAKDEWLQVRSKNFFLIGNASEKEIRKAATKLEQFRETFRQLFAKAKLSTSIPTNVVVFKSDGAYKPFKPKRGDGKTDNWIAGYFQPGEDVNYITLAADGTDEEMYGTIFHEYVHYILDTNFGKSDVPPWFNEGLAEYYQTFQIEGDIKVKLGLTQANHLMLLNQSKLMPLDSLFKVTNRTLHQNGGHSRSIFYAQSWALVHYLIQSGKVAGLDKFLLASVDNVPQEKAFQDAFQMTYAEMEKELRKYVSKSTYQYHSITFKEKLTFDTEMKASPLPEAATNAYLGDLLYHTNRADDAEPYLKNALAANPELSMANTALGMVKIRQRKFDEAKTYLEKAITQDQKNHLAYYQYAYLLSREGRDEFGYVRGFPAERAAMMREMLKKAISINPEFTESYELLAFVSLVGSDHLDEAVAGLRTAQKYQPGNQRYAIRIAEIYARQQKFAEATAIAEKIARTTDDAAVRSQAENILNNLNQIKEIQAKNEAALKQFQDAVAATNPSGTRPVLIKRSEKQPSPEEIKKAEEENSIRALNRVLRKPEKGEKQVLGFIQKIECKGRTITYSVQTETENLSLTSKDFQGLSLTAFIPEEEMIEVGCDAKLDAMPTVLTYKPSADAKTPVAGELIAVEMVPKNFRFVDANAPDTVYINDMPPPRSSGSAVDAGAERDFEAERRASILRSIAEDLRKPLAGETRALGTIEKSECTAKGMFFYIKTGSGVLRLNNAGGEALEMKNFSPEAFQITCNMRSLELPVVFTYKPAANAKAKTAGDLISLEFVPQGFVLD